MKAVVRERKMESLPSGPDLSAADRWHLLKRTDSLRRSFGERELAGHRGALHESLPVSNPAEIERAFSFLAGRSSSRLGSFLDWDTAGRSPADLEAAVSRVLPGDVDRGTAWQPAAPDWVEAVRDSANGFGPSLSPGVIESFFMALGTAVSQDVLDWAAHLASPPSRPSGKLKVRLSFGGRSKPIPLHDPRE